MHRTIPIIKLFRTLIVSVQIEISDRLVLELKNDIAHEIQAEDVQALVIEVSGIDLFDSYIARSIRDIAHICKMMGVKTVLVGLDPAMAITLVEMGMMMHGVETALNLEIAMARYGGVVALAPERFTWDTPEATAPDSGESDDEKRAAC